MPWETVLFALAICSLGLGLMVWHVVSWRQVKIKERDEGELDFFRRQYRRRMQTSAMIVILGAAILCGPLVTSALVAIIYWIAILIVVFWIALLAFADAVAAQYHFGRQRQHVEIERVRLEAEVRRIKSQRSNGQHHANGNGQRRATGNGQAPDSESDGHG